MFGRGGLEMLETAMLENYPKACGQSPAEYVADATKGLSLKLPVDVRQEEAKRLVSKGLSQRQAAAVLGVSHETVRRDTNVTANAAKRAKAKGKKDAAGTNVPQPKPDAGDKARKAKQQRAGTIELLYKMMMAAELFRNKTIAKQTLAILRNHPDECEAFWRKPIDEIYDAVATLKVGCDLIAKEGKKHGSKS